MKLQNDRVVLSPSDLMRFRGCTHATALDLRRLRGEKLLPAEDSGDMVLLQGLGDAHEHAFLESLRTSGFSLVEIDTKGRSTAEVIADTRAALSAGPDFIYQAALSNDRWTGFADFLERVERPSALGNFSYEIIDTKLKKSPAPQHILQLSVYADLLAELQGVRPDYVHIVLGDRRRVSLRLADYSSYAARLKERLEGFITSPWSTEPEPVAACGLCRWRDLCNEQWNKEDNLCLVAGIGKSQRSKLEAVGIATIGALAACTKPVPRLAPETLAKLRTQARLQHARRQGGKPEFEVKPIEAGCGLARLPEPNPGDLFFDMEGDPYYEEGLEYLFGIYADVPGVDGFKAFWAHDRDAERQATADVLTFFIAHLKRYPAAHIYHYAQYEVTALRKLASRHGVGEALLDQLHREQRFVDLYRVVQQGLFASEPSYSIKNIEAFYMPARDDAVKTAMDSVVNYEEWRETQDADLLEEIRAYNETDCRSTSELRDWLLRDVRPKNLGWYRTDIAGEKLKEQDDKTAAAEAEREALRIRKEAVADKLGREVAELLFELTWFHQREDKPQWWAMFDRAERDSDELFEDLESLAGLKAIDKAVPLARSLVRHYRFPDQETKLRPGVTVRLKENLTSVNLIDLDHEHNIAEVKFGPSAGDPPDEIDLIPGGPIDNKVLQGAVLRVVENFLAGGQRYKALDHLLRKQKPQLTGRHSGGPLLAVGEDVVAGTVRVVMALDNSCLAIQGPPGTGKTYVSSQAILALLKVGKRVAVTSNSHKAVDNLLSAIADRAREQDYDLMAVKKISRGQGDDGIDDPMVTVTDRNDALALIEYPLVGGTAWLFARPEHDQAFDYLFVDEAGQVSLANILATGSAAKNIVLVGDPMQLAQPIQGDHPGETGKSSLQYLLAEHPTVPPDRGIFLPASRRMHPDVCRYISDVVYEGRLGSDEGAARQALLVEGTHDILTPHGIRFVEIEHEGNSQSSVEEAEAISRLWRELIGQTFQDRHGETRKIGGDNILVVSPYNAQVNLIKAKLPAGARVGTVDRFQGQEAPVCLISMATSSAEEMPRNIEFLFSVNRLNVAISRAQVLAVVFTSPRLLDVPCTTIEQMRLVNALCAVRAHSVGG